MKMLVCSSDFEKGVLEAFHMFINIFKDQKTLVEHSLASYKKIFDIISLKKGRSDLTDLVGTILHVYGGNTCKGIFL